MRTTCFALTLLLVPAMATAQHARADKPHARPAEHARPADPPPSSLGSIGLPLPSIGLGLPSIGIQPVPGSRLPAPGTDHRVYSPDHVRRPRPSVVYVVPPYPYANVFNTPAPPPSSSVTVVAPEPQSGTLRLDVDPPGRWQLFVDGVFYGTADDLGTEVDLPPGPRRIEIRATGYQPLVFDARIEVDRTITYRGALVPVGGSARPALPPETPVTTPSPVAATGSRTMYLIPGCYLGNVIPQKARLRDGCDLGSMKTVTP